MVNESDKYIQWTEWWNILVHSSWKKRQEILEQVWIVDEALLINEIVDQVLNWKKERWLLAQEWTIPSDEEILKLDHSLYSWINSNDWNKEWMKKNKDNLKLVMHNWKIHVQLFWDIIELEEESDKSEWNKGWKIIPNWEGNLLYSKFATINLAELKNKRFPKWSYYLNNLPWDDNNKKVLFEKVLWLKRGGFYRRDFKKIESVGEKATYWCDFKDTEQDYWDVLLIDTNRIDIVKRVISSDGHLVRFLAN
jgi:hypothetical protein